MLKQIKNRRVNTQIICTEISNSFVSGSISEVSSKDTVNSILVNYSKSYISRHLTTPDFQNDIHSPDDKSLLTERHANSNSSFYGFLTPNTTTISTLNETITNVVQTELDCLEDWFSVNELSMNVSMTQVIEFKTVNANPNNILKSINFNGIKYQSRNR
ncbi:hypothetical protein J6590_077700 [Homalodisca vitripennis]|nr:hypothetical protein J6590_077700 [Homalodisca vitripennis]